MAMTRSVFLLASTAVLLAPIAAPAGEGQPRSTDTYLEQTRQHWQDVANRVWGFAETSLQEKNPPPSSRTCWKKKASRSPAA